MGTIWEVKKMNDRLITIIATISAIALVAIGVGYAYTAMTTNTGNTVTSEYLLVVPSDGTDSAYSGTFNGSVAFDTRTVLTDKGQGQNPRYVEEVEYSLEDGSFVTISNHEYASMGQIYLTIDEQQSDENYNVSVIVDDGDGLNMTDYSYYIMFKIGSADDPDDAKDEADGDTGTFVQMTTVSGDVIASTSTITNSASNTHTVVLIEIYVGLHGGDSITKALNTKLDENVLDDVTFEFIATTV